MVDSHLDNHFRLTSSFPPPGVQKMTETTVADGVSVIPSAEPVKRKRGRPPGSKNKSGNLKGMHDNLKIGGKEKGTSHSHLSSKLVEDRDALMLAAHLTGTKIPAVAKEFGVSLATTHVGIDKARRSKLFQDAKDFVGVRLLPKALRVLEAALDEGNIDVAVKVAEGLKVLDAKQGWSDDAGSGNPNEEFESWRVQLIRRRSGGVAVDPAGHPSSPAEGPAVPPGDCVDGTVI